MNTEFAERRWQRATAFIIGCLGSFSAPLQGGGRTVGGIMTEAIFRACRRCGGTFEAGFVHKAPGISFVVAENWSKLLSSVAAFFRSDLCRSCELYSSITG
jgi:hypothetical protein